MVKASLDLTGLVPNLPQVQKPNFPSPKLSSGTQKPYQITVQMLLIGTINFSLRYPIGNKSINLYVLPNSN